MAFFFGMEHRLPLTLCSSHRSRLLVLRAASEAALLEQPSRLPVMPRSGARCLPALPFHSPWHRSRWAVELRSIHLRTPARALPRSRCASLFSWSAVSQPPVPLLPACSDCGSSFAARRALLPSQKTRHGNAAPHSVGMLRRGHRGRHTQPPEKQRPEEGRRQAELG